MEWCPDRTYSQNATLGFFKPGTASYWLAFIATIVVVVRMYQYVYFLCFFYYSHNVFPFFFNFGDASSAVMASSLLRFTLWHMLLADTIT